MDNLGIGLRALHGIHQPEDDEDLEEGEDEDNSET